MKTILPLALAVAILLAGCDTGTQAGTSSETQTALQELADNVRTNPALAKPTGPANVTARKLASIDSCVGAELTWIQDGFWQEEVLPPTIVDQNDPDPGSRWLARRVGLAVDRNGQPKVCGDGGYFQVHWHQEILDTTGGHSWATGIASGTDQIRGLDRFEYDLTSTYPTGFQMTWHEIDSTPQPSAGWFNWKDFTQLEVYSSFGGGRYRILRPVSIDTSRIPRFDCSPILDLKDGAKTVGHFCKGIERDSTLILDARDHRIPGNFLASHPIVDSMGLTILSATLGADSLRISLRIQVPTAPGFSPALTRICLQCSDSGMTTVGPWVLDLPTGQAEMGTHIYWSIPAPDFDPASKSVSILRRYPDWRSQIAHSTDSLSGWWIVSTTNLSITSTP
jgi:hypothetical protein